MDVAFATKFFGALFAIMNPFVNLPIFLAMNSDRSVSEQRAVASMVVLYTAVMCIIIAIAGRQILGFFGVTIDNFRIAGGLVLLGIAFSMLNGREVTAHERADHEKKHDAEQQSIAFYPLTFPMLVGPGTITSLIIYAAQTDSADRVTAFATVLGAILLLLFVVLFFASAIGKLLSTQMRVIMSRLMGMILAAIAVEMILDGTKAVLPGLA